MDLVMNLSTLPVYPHVLVASSSDANMALTAAFLSFYLSFFSNSLLSISIMCVFYSSFRLAYSSFSCY
jgi:hypothetical protein